MSSIKAMSLFSSVGIDEFYLNKIGIDVCVANEVSKSRADAHSILYPSCEMICGDITDKTIIDTLIEKGKEKGINLLIATPPCQGVSSAGKNKTEESILKDPRNFLVLSSMEIMDELTPDYFIIENVPRFDQMYFPYKGRMIPLYELLVEKYAEKYEIKKDIFNAADYGVPQTRYRIVYRVYKKGLKWPNPRKSKTITLREAIGDLPSLEAGEKSSIKNHFARKHPDNHIECMRHTPEGKSAFYNEYYYPKKPDGTKIIGYKNSYKRMKWDYPAPTITMRNEIISSQENVHPGRPLGNGEWSDARVLTLRELLIVSSLPADIDLPGNLSETAFRLLVGEGIPPLLFKKIMKGIVQNDC